MERDTILIVDDLEINRSILKNIFKKNYDIAEVSDGDEALEYIRENSHKIIAILLDLVMSRMNGIEVLEKLREEKLVEEVPIFIITADNSEEVMYKAYELGVKDILEKPFVPYFLKKRIDSVIELYKIKQNQSELIEKKIYKIKVLNDTIMEILVMAIELRSSKECQHVKRVKDLTYKMLIKLRELKEEKSLLLSDEDIDAIVEASVFHDIGKIGLPDNILKKSEELTKEESERFKEHSELGAEILEKLDKIGENIVFKYAHDICKYHHERWDGSGYPEGLKGNEISIWAQVVGIVDTYESLLNNRVYEEVANKNEAIERILSGKSGDFNPIILRAFSEIEK